MARQTKQQDRRQNLHRKYIRIALTQDDDAMFSSAKANAERDIGISMSDNMFALSVLRQSIKLKTQEDNK